MHNLFLSNDSRYFFRIFTLSLIAFAATLLWFTLSVNNGQTLFASDHSAARGFEDLRITEIMYDPIKSANFSDNEHEFIEFHNQGATVLDMSGVSFSDGIGFTIPSGTQLAADEYLVIAASPAAFQDRYGALPNNVVGYTGQLSNSGERVALSSETGVEILAFTYATDVPHLQLANGGGYSLVPVDPTTTPTNADDWRISSAINGSPGQDDAPPVQVTSPPIKVNEVLAHTDLPQIDFIELYNPTDEIVDISGWYITDKLDEPTRFRIPFGTQVPAQGYLVFDQDELGFAFFAEGDSAFLLAADVAGNLTGYSHGFDFGVTPNGVSLGRCTAPDGNGGVVDHFPLQRSITEGQQNGFPLIAPIVISEIHYAPSNGDEFVELTNRSSSEAPLYDVEHPENLWKMDGIGIFTFTVNTMIPANGTLLVTSIEPSIFRSRYSIPASVQIQGPFSRQLSNNGEKVTLQRPDMPNPDGSVPYINVDLVDYRTDSSWPSVAASNRSLERIALHEFGNSPSNWQASAVAGGTPGSPSALFTSISAITTRSAALYRTDSIYLPFVATRPLLLTNSCFTTSIIRSSGIDEK